MMLPAAVLLTLAAHLSVAGIARIPGSEACDLAERRAELFKRAAVSEDDGYLTSTLPRLFAEQGLMLTAGPLDDRGPAGVARVLGRDTLNATTRARMATIGGDISADGMDGFTYGYVDARRANGDSLLAWYHAYWRRGKSGQWEILAMARRRRPPGQTSAWKPPAVLVKPECSDPRGVDTSLVLQEIMAADLAFSDSAARSVSNAFAMFASVDAAKSGKEAAYIYGKEAIRELFEPPPPAGLKWEPEIGSAARSGDFGFTVGAAGPRTVDANAPARNPATAGHYFTIWRRDAEGRWRYVID